VTHVIYVTEQDATREVELCRLEGNPQPIVDALRAKRLRVRTALTNKLSSVPKYCSVRTEER
jgi:hypothetical protein